MHCGLRLQRHDVCRLLECDVEGVGRLLRPLEIAADSDVGAALGAARLAICAAEGADPAEVCAAPEILRTIEPDPGLVPRYREGYARYRELYPALRAGA